jgi:hypothetical protein
MYSFNTYRCRRSVLIALHQSSTLRVHTLIVHQLNRGQYEVLKVQLSETNINELRKEGSGLFKFLILGHLNFHLTS